MSPTAKVFDLARWNTGKGLDSRVVTKGRRPLRGPPQISSRQLLLLSPCLETVSEQRVHDHTALSIDGGRIRNPSGIVPAASVRTCRLRLETSLSPLPSPPDNPTTFQRPTALTSTFSSCLPKRSASSSTGEPSRRQNGRRKLILPNPSSGTLLRTTRPSSSLRARATLPTRVSKSPFSSPTTRPMLRRCDLASQALATS